ncbi:hypothetical protein ACFSHT_02525 [Paraburkholderia silviterrae]|uniref:Uncharacterized protein n=1 Tax=Paraburkholderia silviterrae TaxID=2528715 RepID=A0A4R5MGM9_9BURK|nr:hypothetical protein [Paraburkholderia silviterrae]TDG26463.1 hypothetical protein EYW47_03720 [Paraburkholderia silviterrae]
MENHSHYSANSMGGSAGLSPGPTSDKAVGPASVPGAGGVVPMMAQNESGDESATTRSAISAGTISITDPTHQKQDVATLSRDTTDTNGTVANTPDVNNILNQQADTMQAAQAAGQVVAQGIGAYADKKRDDALDAAKTAFRNGDLDGASAALADFDSWSEGGGARAALHIAGGGLIGGLGGGALGAFGGAAGAGLSSTLTPQTKEAGDAVAGGTGSSLIGNISGNILSGLAGGLIGGSAGAAMASNVNLYNQNNDKNETEAQKGARELRKQLDKERAMLGQGGAKVPSGAQAATVPSSALAAGAAAGGKSTFWSSTKDKTPVENAYSHSTKHGDEFPAYQNSVQYVQGAQDFVNNPPPGTLIKTRPNGDTLYYDPATNTFASKTIGGAPKTMFKPSAGMDYWNRQ